MISSATKPESIEGLTKREQSKLERLMRNEQIQKAQSNAKSYKREASKTKLTQEPEPRKISRTEQKKNEDPGVQGTATPQHEQIILSTFNSVQPPKIELKMLKAYNPSFYIDGGEQCLFSYVLSYEFSQKQKLINEKFEDREFLDQLDGKQLEILSKEEQILKKPCLLKQFQEEKHKIKEPFDQNHKSLLKKIKLKFGNK